MPPKLGPARRTVRGTVDADCGRHGRPEVGRAATGRGDPAWLYLGAAVDVWRVELVGRPRPLTHWRASRRVVLSDFSLGFAMYPAHLFIVGDMAKAVPPVALTQSAVALPMRAHMSNEPLI